MQSTLNIRLSARFSVPLDVSDNSGQMPLTEVFSLTTGSS